ncbi:hypothetical protein I316_01626 [Kwoniella heveanensis BCC8398]|uniref:Septin-type G domain-containing protein n=1 Tax=Kwoniella heveanensis BCC8398 TaxID=1296120 RepID=A0A1B9GZE0_9TREE|nr:hypothetical protein I316_01626 [Kwoniella heveanensis BCC8398]
MTPGFLLRKRARPQSSQQSSSASPGSGGHPFNLNVRPSLSLPDLTTPLLDGSSSSWEEVPPFAFRPKSDHYEYNLTSHSQQLSHNHNHKLRPRISTSPTHRTPNNLNDHANATDGTLTATATAHTDTRARNKNRNKNRNRKPSLIGAGSGGEANQQQPPQFHRPFTPKMIISPLSPGDRDRKDLSFRISTAQWSNNNNGNNHNPNGGGGYQYGFLNSGVPSMAPGGVPGGPDNAKAFRETMMSMISRRKGRKKGVTGKLNLVVAGGKGVGKTSFINLLLNSLSEAPSHHSSPPPTLKPKAYTTVSTVSERLLVRFIDTPGLDLALSDELKAKERERGVAGLLRLVEDRFEEMWREERKVRRQVGAEEGLVHLVLYLIDARQVLVPPHPNIGDQVDWSCLGLFDDEDSPSKNKGNARDAYKALTALKVGMEPRLSKVEVDIIARLSKRTNILPVLTHSDCLTTSELEKVREAIRRDLSAKDVNIPGKGFGVFFPSEEEESRKSFDSMDDPMELDGGPPTPDSMAGEDRDQDSPGNDNSNNNAVDEVEMLPYAVFMPDRFDRSNFRSVHSNAQQSKSKGKAKAGCNSTSGAAAAASSSGSDAGSAENPCRNYPWGKASVYDEDQSDFMVLRDAVLGDYAKILRNSTREVLYEKYRTEKLLSRRGTTLPQEERDRILREIEKV